jgi:hypothetical protein
MAVSAMPDHGQDTNESGQGALPRFCPRLKLALQETEALHDVLENKRGWLFIAKLSEGFISLK